MLKIYNKIWFLLVLNCNSTDNIENFLNSLEVSTDVIENIDESSTENKNIIESTNENKIESINESSTSTEIVIEKENINIINKTTEIISTTDKGTSIDFISLMTNLWLYKEDKSSFLPDTNMATNTTVSFVFAVIFSFLMKHKTENFSLFENLVLKCLDDKMSNDLKKIPTLIRIFMLKNMVFSKLVKILSGYMSLDRVLNFKYFSWMLFEIDENKETLSKINNAFMIYCFMALILDYIYNTLIWNLEISNNSLYFHLIKGGFVLITSALFVLLCVYKTSDFTTVKKVKLDICDVNSYASSLFNLFKFIEIFNNEKKESADDFVKMFNKFNDNLNTYKKEYENKWGKNVFYGNLVIIFLFTLKDNWSLMTNLPMLKDSKERKNKSIKGAESLSITN